MAAGPEAPPEGIAYNRLFPWMRLFGAFGVASDPKKLILAAVGLVVFQLGGAALDRTLARAPETQRSWFPRHPIDASQRGFWTTYASTTIDGQPQPIQTSEHQLAMEPPPIMAGIGARLQSAPTRLGEPVGVLVGPFVRAFAPAASTSSFIHALLSAFWGALVWGLFGGAIARIALLQVSRSRSLTLTGAVRFAASNAVSLVSAPLAPLLAVGAFALLCALFGLVYRIPSVGATFAGALALVPLLAGLVMTVVLICLALGWPLMAPAVAAEGEDSFDALSRSFAYVNQRRGLYLFYVVLAWLVGSVGLVFVDVFAGLVVHLAEWGLSFSAPRDTLLALWGRSDAGLPAAAAAHGFWLGLVGLLAHAWIYSYFWSSSAIVYLLLRHNVDGTPFHELHVPDSPAAPVSDPVPDPVAVDEATPAEAS
ncbi:MAG: hypothetical protein P4L84_04370 [Isosphaeraceae bacterium]|nr:hypothetical protein [Isosphaeraceae bacterium]